MEENKLVPDTHVWVSIFHKRREEDLVNAIPEKDYCWSVVRSN